MRIPDSGLKADTTMVQARIRGSFAGRRLVAGAASLAAALAVMLVPAAPALAEPGIAGAAGFDGGNDPRLEAPLWLQNPWTGATRLVSVPQPDTRLWNPARIDHFEAATLTGGPPPVGVLTIERLGLKAPVYNGMDEHTLDRGLGRIPGMARPDEPGHHGISGHRDGYFRALKDLREGDRIEVRTPARLDVYVVEGFSIVDKHDVSPLRAGADQWQLTLVTCYPFYFVGSAPRRYIVHARPVVDSPEAAAMVSGE